MKMEEFQKQVLDRQSGQIAVERETLTNRISELQGQIVDAYERYGSTIKEKAAAKEAYNQSLDGGSEAGMKAALNRIKKANTDRETLIAKIFQFGSIVADLQSKHEELLKRARDRRHDIEIELQKAQTRFETVDFLTNQCKGLLPYLNNVRDRLSAIQRELKPVETKSISQA